MLKDIARINELHHYFPRQMLVGSYFNNIASTIFFTGILFFLMVPFLYRCMVRHPAPYLVFFFFLSMTNLFHRFTHERDCETPAIILFFQKLGIICDHEHHRMHHVTQPDGKYCVIFPITNYLLDTLLFWRFLEKIISVFGVHPDRKPVYSHYKPIHNYMHENAKKECPKRPTDRDVAGLFQRLDSFIQC